MDKAYTGSDSQCHWNTAKLFRDGKIDKVVVGYAKNDEGWHQHTWGLKDGQVIETTESNEQNSDWFGAPLDHDDSKAFSEHVLDKKNAPGNGNVRTKQGGHKIGEAKPESAADSVVITSCGRKTDNINLALAYAGVLALRAAAHGR